METQLTIIGMKKVKPIMRLFHQFSKLLDKPKLDAYEIADALEARGLIELIAWGEDERPTHYRETAKLHAIPTDSFNEEVRLILSAKYRPLK